MAEISSCFRQLTLKHVASQGDSNQDRIDKISEEHGRVVRAWGDTWMHPESSMKIRRATFAGFWDRGPRSSCDYGR